MKRYIYIMMAMLTGAFASCSKEDISRSPGTEGTQSVTINLVADDAVNTRAAATGISQYIIEVYSDAAYTTPENIFGEGATNQATSANGSFSLILDRTREYYCLFWADKDAEAYTTATLKTVTLAPGTAPAEAWFGTQQISGNQPTQTITLKRAVAKLNLLETGKLIAGTTLTATFDQPTVFNVATGEVTNALAARTETITLESTISGSKETPVQLGTDYFILCPASTQYVATVTFRCGEEEAFDVDNVPFQANRATNIKGHYTSLASETFTVACDDDWNTTDNEKNLDARIWDGKYPTSEAQAKEWMGAETSGATSITAAEHIFTITAARQLAALHYLMVNDVKLQNAVGESDGMGEGTVNDNYAAATYNLAADINLNNKQWTPIGYDPLSNTSESLYGTFNGQGHTVSGMNVSGALIRGGLFVLVHGTVQFLNVKGNINTTSTAECGGIVAYLMRGKVAFCSFQGSITAIRKHDGNGCYAGGIAGYVIGSGSTTPAEVISCYSVLSTISATNTGTAGAAMGGIGGRFWNGTIKGCYWQDVSGLDKTNPYGNLTGEYNSTENNGYFTDAAGANSAVGTMNSYDAGYEYHWQAGGSDSEYPVLVKKQ